MNTAASVLPRPAPGPRTRDQLDAFAAELDALKASTRASLGEPDRRYILRLLWTIRGCESAGRAALLAAFAGGIGTPWWWAGAALLALAKCLENMEFGHNVMHGQYEWTNDPRLQGKSHEWDNACAKEEWRSFHNHMHHHYTNVLGVDRDFGYGMLRLSAETPWEPRYLLQAPYAIVVALLFEWAIAIHNLEVDRLRVDREATKARMRRLWPTVRAKMGRQLRKDYLWWPLLGGVVSLLFGHGLGAGAVAVLAGNGLANVVRNLWTFVVIFCGHFTEGVHTFDPALVADEPKGHWYLRQILGSSNLRGGWLFHVMTGNLSHQVEHHLFPDLPARRYAALAPAVQDICRRHGVPYNTGSLPRQFLTVVRRIVRHSFPGGQRTLTRLASPSARS